MAYTFEELKELSNKQLEQLIDLLVADPDNDRLTGSASATRLAISPVHDLLVDSRFGTRVATLLADSRLATRVATLLDDSLLYDPVLPGLLDHAPLAARLAHPPLADLLVDSPLAARLTHVPLAERLADVPFAALLARIPLAALLAQGLADRRLPTRLAGLLLDRPLADRVANSPLAQLLADRYEAMRGMLETERGLVVTLLTTAIGAAWVEVVVVDAMMEMPRLDDEAPPQTDEEITSVRDVVPEALVLPQDLTEDQAASLSRALEPLGGRVQQLLNDGAFDKLGPGVTDEVDRTLDSLFDRELAPRDGGRAIKSQIVLGLVHRLAGYANQVDPNPQVSSTLTSFGTAIDEPGGNSDAAKQTADEIVEEADWVAAQAAFEEYATAEFLRGRDPDVVAIELSKVWTSKYVTVSEILGWRASQVVTITGSAGAARGFSQELFGQGLPGLILGAILAGLALFYNKK